MEYELSDSALSGTEGTDDFFCANILLSGRTLDIAITFGVAATPGSAGNVCLLTTECVCCVC